MLLEYESQFTNLFSLGDTTLPDLAQMGAASGSLTLLHVRITREHFS